MNIPKEWTFNNAEIAKNFNQHVREQLPWYDLITNAITHLARHYITPDSTIYDIGAATGNIGKALQETITERNANLIAIEPSEEMAHQYDGPGTLQISSAQDANYEPASLIILYLTLQFIPPQHRKQLLEQLQAALLPGGAIILVDKETPPQGYIGIALYRLTLAEKIRAGVTPDEILSKELSLSGIQRTITPPDAPWVEWFRFGVFAGYIYEKPS